MSHRECQGGTWPRWSTALCFQTCTEVIWDLTAFEWCYNKDIMMSKMLGIFRAPFKAKELQYVVWAWACFLVKCSTIKRKITILLNGFKMIYGRVWPHPCEASGMSSYLEHVFRARPVAENSSVLWCHLPHGRCDCGLWHREWGIHGKWPRTSLSTLPFLFLPSHSCPQHPGNTQEAVSNSWLRKTRSYSRSMVMKYLCAWRNYSWSSSHSEDRLSQI